MGAFDWAVFDLGGVIMRQTRALPGLAERLDVTIEALAPGYSAHRLEYDAGLDPSEYWTRVAREAGAAEPDAATIAELETLDLAGWNVPDLQSLALVTDLLRGGLRLAVLSNAPSAMGRLVASQQWTAPFGALLFSADLGVVKPDPAIYRRLLAELDAEPGRVVFLDDRLDNVQAAQALGIAGVLFTNAKQARAALAELGLPCVA